MMRRMNWGLCFAIISVLMLSTLSYAAPNQMAFQGILKNSSGTVVSGSVSVIFKIYDAPSGGNTIWTQTKTITAVRGHFTTTLDNLLPSYFPESEERYLGIKVGSDSEMVPRQHLVAVPLAYYANEAGVIYKNPSHLANPSGTNQFALKIDGSNNFCIGGFMGISGSYPVDIAGDMKIVYGLILF